MFFLKQREMENENQTSTQACQIHLDSFRFTSCMVMFSVLQLTTTFLTLQVQHGADKQLV